MARKIKFALEMADGAKVRGSIEELREHFDLEKAVGYFLSGKLTEWLEDRYYEDEAEALDAIDKDAPDLRARLCEALGVECEDDEALDIGALERLNEKKAVLRQKTSDESIIANSDKTALTQEDLADLLDMDEPVIYLCGDSFNIPARVKNKKYVGILGTPTISIKVNSQEDLDEKGIVFENVKLPWGKQNTEITSEEKKPCPKCGANNVATAKFCNSCGATMIAEEIPTEKPWPVPKAQMKAMFASAFNKDLEYLAKYSPGIGADDVKSPFLIVDVEEYTATANLTQEQKALALSLICDDKYTEEDLIQLRISEDMTTGWAFTKDSFCIKDSNYDNAISIPYESANFDSFAYLSWSSDGNGRINWLTGEDAFGMKPRIAYTDMLGDGTDDALRNCLKNMNALLAKTALTNDKSHQKQFEENDSIGKTFEDQKHEMVLEGIKKEIADMPYYLLAPEEEIAENNLKKLRKELEVCEDSKALQEIRYRIEENEVRVNLIKKRILEKN